MKNQVSKRQLKKMLTIPFAMLALTFLIYNTNVVSANSEYDTPNVHIFEEDYDTQEEFFNAIEDAYDSSSVLHIYVHYTPAKKVKLYIPKGNAEDKIYNNLDIYEDAYETRNEVDEVFDKANESGDFDCINVYGKGTTKSDIEEAKENEALESSKEYNAKGLEVVNIYEDDYATEEELENAINEANSRMGVDYVNVYSSRNEDIDSSTSNTGVSTFFDGTTTIDIYRNNYTNQQDYNKAVDEALAVENVDYITTYSAFELDEPTATSSSSQPIQNHLYNKFEGYKYEVDETKIEDTSDATPFLIDALDFSDKKSLEKAITKALETNDSVTVTNTDKNHNELSDEDFAISTSKYNPFVYEARNVKDIGTALYSDTYSFIHEPGDKIVQTATSDVYAYSTIDALGKSYNLPISISTTFIGNSSYTDYYIGSWTVPKERNGKEVKKASLQSREIFEEKQVDIYKKGSKTKTDTIETGRACGINFYKIFEYK